MRNQARWLQVCRREYKRKPIFECAYHEEFARYVRWPLAANMVQTTLENGVGKTSEATPMPDALPLVLQSRHLHMRPSKAVNRVTLFQRKFPLITVSKRTLSMIWYISDGTLQPSRGKLGSPSKRYQSRHEAALVEEGWLSSRSGSATILNRRLTLLMQLLLILW